MQRRRADPWPKECIQMLPRIVVRMCCDHIWLMATQGKICSMRLSAEGTHWREFVEKHVAGILKIELLRREYVDQRAAETCGITEIPTRAT